MNSNLHTDADAIGTTTTSDACDKSTMSEGARILIEALKTEPAEFKPGGKYNWVLNLLTASRSSYTLPMLSTRDHAVLVAAVEQYLVEPEFTEMVVKAALGVEDEPNEEKNYPQGFTQAMTLGANGSLGIGTAPAKFWGRTTP